VGGYTLDDRRESEPQGGLVLIELLKVAKETAPWTFEAVKRDFLETY